MEVLLVSFFVLNIIEFVLTGYDKYLAVKHKRRIPENTLFTIAFFGGSIGLLLAMLLFRHKTSKSSFLWKFFGIFIFQVLLLGYILKTNLLITF